MHNTLYTCTQKTKFAVTFLCDKILLNFKVGMATPIVRRWLLYAPRPKMSQMNQGQIAKLSPKPQPQLGAEVVIFPVNPTTQPPTRTSLNLASDKVTAKSKVVYLVELDLYMLLDPS